MASIDLHKCHGGEASAYMRHDFRHDGRETGYRNKDIDPARTGDCYCIGAGGGVDVGAPWGAGGARPTAQYEASTLDERIATLDSIHPPKRKAKDRVTHIAYSLPAPVGLTAEQVRQFFELAYRDVICHFAGGRSNCSTAVCHMDEVHSYTDSVTGESRLSRPHMQGFMIPWTDEYGINCKHFMSRERLRQIQKDLDDLCFHEFGVHYLTGEGRRDPKRSTSVEDLKQATASKELEQLQQTSKDDFYHSLAVCYKDMQSEHPERFDNNFYMGIEREQAQKKEPDISDSADLGLFPDPDVSDGTDDFDWGDM